MKRALALVVAAVALAGCGSYPSHYKVVIPPTMPAAVDEHILDALAAWQKVTPVTFTVVFDSANEPGDDTIFIHNAPANGTYSAWTAYNYDHGTADVSLYPSSRSMDLTQVVAHELGHAMGLQHREGATVMWPDPSKASALPTVEDGRDWAALR